MKRGLAVAVGQCWICTRRYQLLHDHHSTKLQSIDDDRFVTATPGDGGRQCL
jgi:hypothetical protein